MKKVAAASFIGTALEGYDFLLYASAAALVFGQLFFPVSDDPLIGTLLAYSTFTIGFIARPIGGIIAGHYGDKIGRKPMLVLTLTVMGVATMLIGFLPTYAQVGILAPILLTLLRFVQGLAYGGEWGGAILMVIEYAPEDKRGFWGSLPQSAVPFGFLLATAVLSASIAISGDQFLVWGWRIPFILSILPVLVGLYIRMNIDETPEFKKIREQSATAKTPVVEAIKMQGKQILLATGAFVLVSGPYYIIISFMLSYGTTTVGVDRQVMLNGVLIASTIQIFACIGFGALSDIIGRKPVLFGGGIFMLAYAYPLFWMVNTADPHTIWFALSLGLLAFGALYGPIAAFFAELFVSNVRYTAASLGYQMGQVFGGGFAPFISTALLAWAGGAYWPVPLYMMVLTLIGLASIWGLAETRKTN
ncbi:MAG: MFS transporter [Rhodospirillaceae bacterium]|jgi:MFS transporter, MHS family, shikimate and dehydroshikimate transport protein|nr:MFS transporter [Rhodospirillaceae bacterium]